MQYDPQELATGTRIEGEHTQDVKLAQKIAMDHLNGDPRYYSKLKAAGLEDDLGDMGGVGAVMPVAPNVAVIKISGPTSAGQASLSSSGMGRGSAPRILKTSSIKAPTEKNKVGPNKVVVSKTPAIGGTPCDPLDHYFGAAMEEGKNWPYDDAGKLEPDPKARGDYQPHQHGKYSDMGGVDNPTGDFGDFDEKPKHGGHRKIKPQGDERGGPEDPDIDTPHMGR